MEDFLKQTIDEKKNLRQILSMKDEKKDKNRRIDKEKQKKYK